MSEVQTNTDVTAVTPPTEVLERFSTDRADVAERRADDFYKSAERNYVRFAAELRRLQDGGAHLLRGYSRFGEYAAARFDGLTDSTARQLSRQGQVLLVLERYGVVDLDTDQNLPRSQAVRCLAVILGKYDESMMVQVYELAQRSGRVVTEDTITAAATALIEPDRHELGAGSTAIETPEEEEQDVDEVEREERHYEILDRIDIIRQHLDDVIDELEDNRLSRALLIYSEDVKGEVDLLGRELRGEGDSAWIEESRGDPGYDSYSHGD